jgi:hypothetical protein
MKNLILLILASLLLSSCKKVDDTFAGKDTLTGILYINDSIIGNGVSKILPNIEVFIQEGADNTDGYMYSLKSDYQGRFNFPFLESKKNYTLYSTYKRDTNSFLFSGSISFEGDVGNQDLVLTPDTKSQNGFIITVVDVDSNPIPNFPVCIFLSKTLWQTGECDFSTFSDTSDLYGRVHHFNVQPDLYYINAKDTINSAFFMGNDSVIVNSVGITKGLVVVKD